MLPPRFELPKGQVHSTDKTFNIEAGIVRVQRCGRLFATQATHDYEGARKGKEGGCFFQHAMGTADYRRERRVPALRIEVHMCQGGKYASMPARECRFQAINHNWNIEQLDGGEDENLRRHA